jgi:hypothetical protein
MLGSVELNLYGPPMVFKLFYVVVPEILKDVLLNCSNENVTNSC